MRHIGIVASSAPQASAPSITIDSVTNFNQERATFNATVVPNGATTSVKFQYSTNGTSWTDSGTVSNLTGTSQSVYFNHSSPALSNGTLYYVRAVATNSAGSTTSGTTSFTTWSLQVYERTTSGGVTFTIPTITPTGDSAVTVSIYDIIMFGGGGGADGGGGGGSGYVDLASAALSGSRSITTSVGAGGADNSGSGATSGGSTTITGDLTTLTAVGGFGSGGTSGGTSGTSQGGGASQSYDYTPGDKFGFVNVGYGGGGGAGGPGSSGTANASGTSGGAGGPGVSLTRGGVTVAGGAGGGGGFGAFDGGPTSNGARGSNNSYGSGSNGAAGTGREGAQGGYMRFRYYAASAIV